MWPVSSARSMNWSGCIMPQCGCGHRTSASNPAISPLVRAHDGLVGQGEGRSPLTASSQRRLQLPPPDHARRTAPAGSGATAVCPPPWPRTGPGPRGGPGRPASALSAVRGHAHGGGGDDRAVGERERLAEGRARSRSAKASTAAVSTASSMSSANSSPPSRAAVSDVPHRGGQPHRGRGQQLVADAVAHRVVDDLEVVQVDEQHAHDRRPVRRARASAWATRSWNSSRLGSPVSASWKARCFSSRSSWRCSVTSRRVSTRPPTVSVAPQVTAPDLDLGRRPSRAGDLPVLVVGAVAHVPAHPVQRADDLRAPAVARPAPRGRCPPR